MSEKSEVRSPKSEVRRLVSGGPGRSWTLLLCFRGFLHQAVFVPDLGETLALAVIVAEDMDLIALAQPAVQLGEELAPLCFSHLRLRSALGQGGAGGSEER